MANWSNPTLTSLYTDFVNEVKNRDVDLALGLDPATTSPTNVPTNALRWNSANKRWEKYDGTNWNALSTAFSIPLGTQGSPSIYFDTDTNTGLYSPGADQVAISTGGQGRVFVDSAGKVGIGTTSPSELFHISGTSNPSIQLTATNDTTPAISVATDGTSRLQITSSSVVGGNINVRSNQELRFGTNNTERVRITSGGLVGIGTTTPGSLLDLRSSSAPSLHISTSGYTPDYRGYSIDLSMSQQTGGINFTTSSPSAFLDLYAGGSAANTGGWNGQIRFFTGGTDSYGTERLRITSTGDVNIKGAGTAGSTQAVSFNGSAPVNSLVIDSSGRVGLGTSSPTENLTVFTATSARLAVTNTSGSSAILLGNQGGSGANNPSVIEAANGNLYFGGGSSWSGGGTFNYTMTLTDGGSVGIGTTSPAYALDVASSVVQIGNSTDAFIQYKSTAGNWHVGAASGNAYVFYSGTYGSGTERARINNQGYLTGTVNGLSSGIYPSKQYYRLNSSYTGSNVNTAQSLFGVGVTLIGSTQYEFECLMILLAGNITTSTSVSFGFGGTATLNNILYSGTGPGLISKVVGGSYKSGAGSFWYSSASQSIILDSTGVLPIDVAYIIKGTVSINAGGTFIPQYKFGAAPGNAWVTAAGSYFNIWPLGASGSNISIGSWA